MRPLSLHRKWVQVKSNSAVECEIVCIAEVFADKGHSGEFCLNENRAILENLEHVIMLNMRHQLVATCKHIAKFPMKIWCVRIICYTKARHRGPVLICLILLVLLYLVSNRLFYFQPTNRSNMIHNTIVLFYDIKSDEMDLF